MNDIHSSLEQVRQPARYYQTERLLLKAREIGQADEMFALIDSNREHLRTWMPWEEGTKSVEDSRQYLELAVGWWERGSTFDFSVYDRASGRMIGAFGLHSINWDNRKCEIGYWLGQDWQGKGLASEAVRLGETIAAQLGFHRVVITCDRQNIRSQQVPVRCGYKLEAILVDEIMDRGKWRDTFQFVKFLNPTIPGHITENLPQGFSILETDPEKFNQLVGKLKESIFSEQELLFWPRDIWSDREREKLIQLNANYQTNYSLHLVVLYGEKLAGWSFGYQDSRESFYMTSSAILPEFRGRGLYSNLLDVSTKILTEKGFQRIWSQHKMTNNRILIPKLKRGFVVTGTSLSDMAGAQLQLTYYTNPTRRKIHDFRTGSVKPDQEIKDIFKI